MKNEPTGSSAFSLLLAAIESPAAIARSRDAVLASTRVLRRAVALRRIPRLRRALLRPS